MILYAKLNMDGYIDSYSDKANDEHNTEFEIDEEAFYELSACSGKCFIVENGVAVKQRDVVEYIAGHKLKADKAKEVGFLKQQLFDSDYKAIKYSEGFYTEEEYLPIRRSGQI